MSDRCSGCGRSRAECRPPDNPFLSCCSACAEHDGDLHGAVPSPEFVLDLLSSDGASRPGDEHLTGLADALRPLDRKLQMDVAAALYTYAAERIFVAVEAEERSKLIPPEEFRVRNLITAERIARLWREAVRAMSS